MKPGKFDALIRLHVGALLEPAGFSCEGSRHCTFWRKLDNGISHFIMPDPLRHSPVYDIKVFATSPLIDPQFDEHFPDSLGIPSDTFCHLNAKHGVGRNASTFPCADEKVFLIGFEKAVRSAILEHAIPYLDAITTVDSLMSTVRNSGFKLAPRLGS